MTNLAVGKEAEERVAVASNWRLVWWRFRRHHLAMASAALLILLYTVVLWPSSLVSWVLGMAGPIYAGGVAALSLTFAATAIGVWQDRSDRSARRMFAFSLLYLFLIFALLLVDHTGGGGR